MSDAPADSDAHLRRAMLDIAATYLPVGARISVGNPSSRSQLAAAGFRTDDLHTGAAPDVAVLAHDEFSSAGEHAERLLADVVEILRPGGHLVATFPNALIDGRDPRRHGARRTWRPADVWRFLGSRGVEVEQAWAPGAHARLNGRPIAFDPSTDADPGLLGAAPVLLVIARTPASAGARSDVFFATLATKVVAAATLTIRPDTGFLLVVHDTFKQRWTIPGGVVDADENPEAAAVRETREESGVDVRCTGLAGVFHSLRPDRLVFLFGAEPTGDLSAAPTPIHTHEVDSAAWVPVDEALRRVAPHTAEQIEHGLRHPGGMWRQD